MKLTFQRSVKEINQDSLEYMRWRASRHIPTYKKDNLDLEELQRFADFGRITAHFMHEFTNPLTAAAIHLELMESGSKSASKEVKKNILLLEKYMRAARSQIKLQSCRTHFIPQREIRRCLMLLGPRAKASGVKLRIRALPQNFIIQGDAVKFSQIYANLLTNAIDACSKPEILVSERAVTVDYRIKGRFLHIYVHDSGKGISSDELPHLFKPFYTTKKGLGRGLGLGLSLVKRMVEEDFNGYIYATSSKTKGTTFSVKLMTRKLEKKQIKAGATLTYKNARITGQKLGH